MKTKKLDIGKRVVAARMSRSLSQAELARRIGCATKTLNWIETGRTEGPDARIIAAIAGELDISCDFLLGFSNELSTLDAIQTDHGSDTDGRAAKRAKVKMIRAESI